MPDKTTLDQSALDYGILVAGIKKMQDTKEELDAEIAAATTQKMVLLEELDMNTKAKERVRQELIDMEQQREAMRVVQTDELAAEKRIIEDQRQTLAKSTKELAEVEAVLNQRKAEVEGKERSLREAQNMNEAKTRANIVESGRLDGVKSDMETRENVMQDRERVTALKEVETADRLHKAGIAEATALSAEKVAKEAAQSASDDRLNTQARFNEIVAMEERNTEALRQLQLFCNVAKEALLYMKNNVRNFDAIDAYFATTFPALVERIDHV